VICFDGTGRWVYETAYPVIKRYGLHVGLFISTQLVGRKDQLTWEEIAELADAGFSIGSKGVTGQDLAGGGREEKAEDYMKRVEDELANSRKEIESRLKRPCFYFAYPHGQFSDLIIALLKQHGYHCAFTREKGSNPFFVDDFKIHRTPISGPMKLLEFQKCLETFHAMELK
jgi:peptidoglycan/xylan/chitin deacetylase (PgdA/CDA1 family)